MNLSRSHWTVWDYYQLEDCIQCVAVNPMEQLSQLQTDSEESHWVILNAIRKIHKLSDISVSSHFYSFFWVRINLIQNNPKPPIKPVLTGLQKDASTCGFWTVFLVLISLLRVPFHSPTLSTISIHRVKDYLKELWISFLGDPGVDAHILKRICLDLRHTENPTCKISLASGHIVSNNFFLV